MTVFEFSGSYIFTPFGVSNLPYRIFGSTLKACSPNIW
nr:MAG TPA: FUMARYLACETOACETATE HYDROLASE [Caudoviricetes sp.]